MARKAKKAARAAPHRTLTAPAKPGELLTLLDVLRYAVSRFNEAELVFAHGTTDPVAEAAFLVTEALHLAPEQFETFAQARVTKAEAAKLLSLIGQRVRAQIKVGSRSTLVVPRRYIVTRFGVDYARLVRADNTVSETPVQTTGGPTADTVEVLSGLRAGDVHRRVPAAGNRFEHRRHPFGVARNAEHRGPARGECHGQREADMTAAADHDHVAAEAVRTCCRQGLFTHDRCIPIRPYQSGHRRVARIYREATVSPSPGPRKVFELRLTHGNSRRFVIRFLRIPSVSADGVFPLPRRSG